MCVWLRVEGSVLDASCVFQLNYNLDINGRTYSAQTAALTVVFMEKVIRGQPKLNGYKVNTAFKSDNDSK